MLTNRISIICPEHRVLIAYLFVFTLFVIIVGRLVSLQLLPQQERGYSFLQKQADVRQIRTIILPASRGTILDRNDDPIAVSLQTQDIYIDPFFFENHNIWLVCNLLNLDETKFKERLILAKNKRFMYVSRGVLQDNPVIEEVKKLKGVHTKHSHKRYYPAGEIIAPLVGLSDINDVGSDGLEFVFNDYLAGKNGSKRVVQDLKSRNIEDLGVDKAPVPGKSLPLSIDLRLQHSAYTAIKKAVLVNQANAAMAVAIKVRTGEILAMANYPSYNPNNRKTIAIEALRNRVVADLFEPGSTLKPFTLIAALENNVVNIKDTIDTSPGKVTIGGKTIYDPHDYGVISLGQLMKKSSQVGIVKVSQKLEAQKLISLLQYLGMGAYSGIGFAGEVSGGITASNKYSDLEKAILSYGYGIRINLLQLVRAYAILANGGVNVELSIMRDHRLPQSKTPIISPIVAKRVNDILQLVSTTGGTAEKASIKGFNISGKTGTSRQVTSGVYDEDIHNSIFVGYAPAESPEVVVAVLVNNPNNIEYSGGEVAAPVFSEIMTDALRYTNALMLISNKKS